jgi:hypothetical protein
MRVRQLRRLSISVFRVSSNDLAAKLQSLKSDGLSMPNIAKAFWPFFFFLLLF